VFYYVTVMNENYAHPAIPADAAEGILRGMYKLPSTKEKKKAAKVQLLGSGTILREVQAAAELLESDWGVPADVWSATSFTEMRRDGMSVERWNRLHADEAPKLTWVEQCLAGTNGPVIAATDYMRAVPDMIRTWVPRRYVTLGTDGFGRSDTRAALRSFFEVDRHHVTIAALKALADDGVIDRRIVRQAMTKYSVDPSRPDPWEG
jgi:pyruvate dehydrogenase E1 component